MRDILYPFETCLLSGDTFLFLNASFISKTGRGYPVKNRDVFSGYHPVVNILYFGLVLVFPMFLMHPAVLIISLGGALAYSIFLNGGKAVRFSLLYMLPLLLVTAVVNPLFNHAGATILLYLPSGNPLTLESVAYGLAAGTMLSAVIIWFSCYTEIMTSDKFVYLFGRVIPAFSLVLSMTLRLVPKCKVQLRTVRQAQRCIGRDVSNGTLLQRVKNAITILSVMITWALENAIETADSMKSRGYGLPGRTAFSIYPFDDRDKAALCWLLSCGVFLVSGWISGGFYWRYFPAFRWAAPAPLSVSVHVVYLALCLTPLILNFREERKWSHLKSKI